MPGTVRTVLLDFGGVVAEEGFRDGLTAIARQAGRDPQTVVPVAYEMAWSTGLVLGHCHAAAFWQAFRQATGIDGTDADLTEAVLSRFVPRPFMLALADRVRAAGLTAAILSDQCRWLSLLDARHGIFAHFDAVFNSYDHGVSKRDAAFFRLALSALGAAPQTALFVDDAPRNVRLAESLGLGAILYRDRPSFEAAFAAACPGLGDTHV